MLERCGRRAFAVESAARKRDDHALAAGKAFGAGRGVVEGLPGNENAVDPGLELARHREIVHRSADDDRVGSEKLVEHGAVGKGVESQVRKRLRGEVAIDQLLAPLAGFELVDDRALMARLALFSPLMLLSICRMVTIASLVWICY